MSRRRLPRGPSNRTARVAGLVRRVVAEGLEQIDDERLESLAVTGVDVDADLHRAIVWYTTFDNDHDPELQMALAEYSPRLRHKVAKRTRLRRAPMLDFRADETLRTAERIENILHDSGSTGET